MNIKTNRTIDEIIKGYKATTIRLTVQPGDLRTLYNLVNTDLDDSGIIDHILNELGVDLWPKDGV